MRLADIAMIQGNAVLSMKLERYSSAYKDSLYQSRGNVVTDKIVEAETDAQITLHQLYYKGRLNIYLCVFIPITIIVIMIVFFLYRKNKQYRNNYFPCHHNPARNKLYLNFNFQVSLGYLFL